MLYLFIVWFLMIFVQQANVSEASKQDVIVPAKSQSPRISCGIAASYFLAILSGRDVDPSFLEQLASTEPQWLSVEEVKKRCQQLGLSVTAYQVPTGANLSFRRPVIAHIETPYGGHYVVLRPTPNGLQLVDPQLPDAPLKPDRSNVIPALSAPLTGYFIAEEGAIEIPRSWRVVDVLLIGAWFIMGIILGPRLPSMAKLLTMQMERHARRFGRKHRSICFGGLSLLLVASGCSDGPSTATVQPRGTKQVVSQGLECLQFPDEVEVGSEPKQFIVRFRNRSSEPITFEQVERTGACCSEFTLVKMEPTQVEPGGEFSVTYECRSNVAKGVRQGILSFLATGKAGDRIFQKELRVLLNGAKVDIDLSQIDFQDFSKKDLPITRRSSVSVKLSEAFDPSLLKLESDVGGIEIIPHFDGRREEDYVVGVKMHIVPIDVRLVSIAQDDEDFLFPVYAVYGNTRVGSNITGTVMPEWSLGKRSKLRLLATRDRCLPDEMTLYHDGKSVSEITTVSVPKEAPLEVSLSNRDRVRFTPNPDFWKTSDTSPPENPVKILISLQGKDGDEAFTVEISTEVLVQ